MKCRKLLIAVLFLTFLLAGCGNKNLESSEKNNTEEAEVDSYTDIFEDADNSFEKSYGEFGFGINLDEGSITENNGKITFTYTGEEIRVPYYVENLDAEINADFGLLAFTDGYAQDYRIEDADGNILSEDSYMHKFNLEVGEKKSFYLVFSPISGKQGETVGFITSTILHPDYVTETNQYGIYYSMSATIPQQITMEQSVESNLTADKNVSNKKILDETLEKLKNNLAGEDLSEWLKETFISSLEPQEADTDGIAYVKDGKINLKFSCYGGPEVLYRFHIYVNNEPVKINESDCITFQTKTNGMVQGEIIIDATKLELKEFNTIYGVFMTAEQDYTISDIFATKPLLLKEKK